MTKLAVAFSLALLSASFAGAADITLKDGRLLREAVFVKQDAATVTFRHAGGFTQVEKTKLPEALAAEYPLDAAEAKLEADRQQQEVLARRAEAERLFALRVQLAAAAPKPAETMAYEETPSSSPTPVATASWVDTYNEESWRFMRIRARQHDRDRDDRYYGRDRDHRDHDRYRVQADRDCRPPRPSLEVRFNPDVHMTAGSKLGEFQSGQSSDAQSDAAQPEAETAQWVRWPRRW